MELRGNTLLNMMNRKVRNEIGDSRLFQWKKQNENNKY